ncbi:transmembrane protein 183 isoform X1 [Neodiprion virginianus]|uniref:transmembrane protein 183 isoform X1 n=1 Tax=Neodiprion virginianus TaxID=2961670 RepID=UPI001EE77CE1|nr:transmembrane protein 183 isoform X1 [Neodiprion virginianus]
MPGSRKAARRKLTSHQYNKKSLGDVTLNDFANSPSGNHARLKKATTNVSSEVKQIMIKEEDNRAWDEKLDEFEGDFEFIEQENEDGKKEVVISKQSKSTRNRTKPVECAVVDTGVQYPVDVWFLLSEYVRPEDVGRFAGICKSAYHVVKTAKFWFHMYKRFYKCMAGLPERLQPECMVRLYGLRTCVIRTLHYSYFPQRRDTQSPDASLQEEPHSLLKRQCCLMWHQKGKNQWFFFFKLKEVPRGRGISWRHTEVKPHRPDLIEMLEDVSANPEDRCKILQVTCLKYTMTPLVIGLILQSVSMTLSPGFRHHRLQLGFGTAVTPKTPASQMLLLDGVVGVRVLDWWHPLYPHQHAASAVLPPSDDAWD